MTIWKPSCIHTWCREQRQTKDDDDMVCFHSFLCVDNYLFLDYVGSHTTIPLLRRQLAIVIEYLIDYDSLFTLDDTNKKLHDDDLDPANHSWRDCADFFTCQPYFFDCVI